MGSNTIRDREAARQLLLFKGLPFIGPCSLTNVDGRIAVRDMKRMMVVEAGHEKKRFNKGQRWAMEDDVAAYTARGWVAIAVLTHHCIPTDRPVFLKDTTVKEVYWNGEWRPPQPGHHRFFDLFVRFWDWRPST